MGEVSIKAHLIVRSIDNLYKINWCGKIADAKPKIENGLPIFVVIGGNSRIELNTINMEQIEDCAKSLSAPKGRSAVSIDNVRIYIKEIDGNELLMGVLTHQREKHFSPIYDKVGWK